jgi:hypothetical protein
MNLGISYLHDSIIRMGVNVKEERKGTWSKRRGKGRKGILSGSNPLEPVPIISSTLYNIQHESINQVNEAGRGRRHVNGKGINQEK